MPPLLLTFDIGFMQVQYANFRSNDAGGSYLKIRGGNLLFLSEPVSLNGMPCGDILHQTQNELWVSNPKGFSKQGASQDANYMVSIKTAFGRASRLVTEVSLMTPAHASKVPPWVKQYQHWYHGKSPEFLYVASKHGKYPIQRLNQGL
jgi:hypothetical protein